MHDSVISQDSAVVDAILRASLECIIVADHHGNIIEFNPSAEQTFGYTRAEVLNRPLHDVIIPPEFKEAHRQGMQHYLNTGEGPVLNKRIEIIGMRSDGSTFPVELAVIPTIQGEEEIFVSFIRDITERKDHERTIQRTHIRLEQLVTSLKGGILLEDETRHIALVNKAFCNMFNIPAPPEALIGSDCSQSAETTAPMFIDPEDFIKRINHILKKRENVVDDVIYLQDGRVFSRDFIPLRDDGTYIGHLWHYRDVTEDHEARLRRIRLLRFEEVNREIIRLFLQLENVDDAINEILAITGHFLDASRAYVFQFRENERILDNTHEWCALNIKPEKDNLQGLPFDDLLPSFFPMIAENDIIAPYHISELPDDIRGILEPQEIQSVLWVPLYLNNRIQGFIGYDDTRAPRRWLPEEITMAHTITESYSRAIERERNAHLLITTRDEALRAARLRTQFVANMSHEIRTPMTGTLGMLELLLETELDDLQQEFASEAFNSSSRLLHIINDILDFSKLEAGQIVLESIPIDLMAILTEVKMTLLPQLKNKDVELNLQVDDDVPYRVYGDATRLRQVLMNLAGNAVKFTSEGHVTLSISALNITNDVAYLDFSVTDTGIGIPQEKLDHIFDSFVQADGSTTRKYGGSGLGLSISKQLVELLGGDLTAKSEPDSGSAFSFMLCLPVAQASSQTKQAEHKQFDLDVLIFDENQTAGYVLMQQMEYHGVTVALVTSERALADLRSQHPHPFDLIFHRLIEPLTPDSISPDMSGHAQQLIYIVDEDAEGEFNQPESKVIHWPINQSALYDLLVQCSQLPRPVTTQKSPRRIDEISGRILLAEDHDTNIDLVKRALSRLDIELDIARNGQVVLDKLSQSSYDLILMDIHMPVLDGLETTKQIRQGEADYRDIPIIALTASGHA